MKAIKILSAMLAIFIGAPIWYFLLYSILKAVQADRLMWFLYWIYVPAGLFRVILDRIANGIEEKEN